MNEELIRRGRASGGIGADLGIIDLSPGCAVCEELTKALEAASLNERRYREALEAVAFLPGAWDAIARIEYCRFCSYSREWIAKHGHGNTCPLYEDAAVEKP